MPRGAPVFGPLGRPKRRYSPRRAGGALALGTVLALAAPHAASAQSRDASRHGARAQTVTNAGPAPAPTSPRAACLDAARRAEAAHGLPPGILVGIALAESGLHAYALSIGGRSHFPDNAAEARRLYNAAGARQSVMAGCVQVNARAHARGSDWPLDPVRATDWAANHLRVQYNRTGNWGDAIRRWNGGSPGTANRLVCKVQAKIQAEEPGSRLLANERCGQTFARDRRNGQAHLELAEAADR